MNFWPSTCQQSLVPLKHTCRMNPEVLAESTDPDFEMGYIDIGNVSLEHGIGQLQAFRFYDAPSRARKIVRKGDTLISTVRTYLKAIAYVQEDHTNWIASTGFAILRPDAGVDQRFLYRVTQASPFVEAVVASSTGVSYPAINPSTLGSIEIPLPDLETQKAIADFLDRETARIDQLIEKKQRMVKLLGEKYSSVLDSKVFSQSGASCTSAKSRHERMPATPEHWRATKILRVCDLLRDGTHLPPPRTDEGIPLLSVRNIVNGNFVNLHDDSLIAKEAYADLCRSFVVLSGDVVMAIVGATIGKVAIVQEMPPFHVQRSVAVMRPSRSLMSSEFLAYYLRTRFFQSLLWESTSFSAQPGIYLTDLGRFPTVLPPLDEQGEIVQQIQTIFAPIERAQSMVSSSIDHLHEFRAALITAAVTGQIDVATCGKRGETDRRLDAIEADMAAAAQPERQQVRA